VGTNKSLAEWRIIVCAGAWHSFCLGGPWWSPNYRGQQRNFETHMSSHKTKARNKQSSIAPQPGEFPSSHRDDQPHSADSQSHATLVAGNGVKEIIFEFKAPGAKEVLLAGEFTDWQQAPIRLERDAEGCWRTKLKLNPGRYLYRYLVDGQWCEDPARSERVPNPFGTFDSVAQIS